MENGILRIPYYVDDIYGCNANQSSGNEKQIFNTEIAEFKLN